MDTIGMPIHYTGFAIYQGLSLNYYAVSYNGTLKILYIFGILMFILGEIGNGYYHYKLAQLRANRTEISVLYPIEGLFNVITCPHYMFELLTWFGWALATFTLCSWIFVVFSAITMGLKAHQRRNYYVNKGIQASQPYPEHIKRLIPYVW